MILAHLGIYAEAKSISFSLSWAMKQGVMEKIDHFPVSYEHKIDNTQEGDHPRAIAL